MSESQLTDLLMLWEERRENGETISVDKLCADSPELAPELGRRIEALEALEPVFALSTPNYSTVTVTPEPPVAVTFPPVPGYELIEELPAGGMGQPFKVLNVALKRIDVLKMMKPSVSQRLGTTERFRQEMQAMARVGKHEHLVTIYHAGEFDGQPYFTMEFIKGGTLRTHCQRFKADVRTAVTLVAKVARAVDFLHKKEMLHRDLKPENILLDGDEPRVSDLGLVRLFEISDEAGSSAAEAPGALTQAGSVLGTPPYMSPEALHGWSRSLTPATDIWALGVILYELVHGRQPFPGKSVEAVLAQIDKGPRPPDAPRPLGAAMEAILVKCLAKEPEQRYRSAAEVAEALERWQPPRSRGQRLRDGFRRHPVLGALALIAVLALFVAPPAWYFIHPDRALGRLENALRHNQSVELIGATGAPDWCRWRMGAHQGKAFTDPEGVFTVHGWGPTAIELLPQTFGHTRFTLHAEIRHLKGGDNSVVGLFWAGTEHKTTRVPVYSYMRLGYDDVHDVKDLFNRLPPASRKLLPPPTGNPLRVLTQDYADLGEPEPFNLHNSTFLEWPRIQPSGFTGQAGTWRKLKVSVSTEQFGVYWIGERAGEVKRQPVEELRRKDFVAMAQQAPNNPALEGLTPELDVGGAVGVFLFESDAAFRNIRFEPGDANP